jgi:ketol-acid reductoisomerase
MSLKSDKPGTKDEHQRQRVAVLGYGTEGRAHALGLREAGYEVAVAVRPGGMSWIRAMEDGFRPTTHGEAVKGADIVALLIPEAEQPALYSSMVAPNIKPGALLVFAHAASVHAGAVEPDPGIDVVLVTCRGVESDGGAVIKKCFVAVHTDATGGSVSRAVAYARAAFGEEARLVSTTTFADETAMDLYAQAHHAGGVPKLLASFEERQSATGYEPDEARMAYYERVKGICADSVARAPAPPSSSSPLSQVQSQSDGAAGSKTEWNELLKKSQRRGVA